MRTAAWMALAAFCACAGARAQTAYDSYDWGQGAVNKLYGDPETAWVRAAGQTPAAAPKRGVGRLHASHRAHAAAESGTTDSGAGTYGATLGGANSRDSSSGDADTRSSRYGAPAGKQTDFGSYSPGGMKSPYDSGRSFTP